MRKEVELILRRDELEKTLKETKDELEKISNNCEHEIVVYLDYDQNISGYESIRYFKCLFCGDDSNYSFGKRIINIVDVDIFYYTNQKRFEIVKRLFIKTATEHPRTGLDKIVKIVQNKINKNHKDILEIVNDLKSPLY